MELNRYDYIILGGGGSGGWLALAMKKQQFFERYKIAIIEKDASKAEDRTWCFWLKSEPDAMLAQLIAGTWKINRHHNKELRLEPYTYYQASAVKFYEAIRNVCPPIVDTIKTISQHEDGVTIIGENNQYHAQYVFTSLPSLPIQVDFLQSFYGWRIRTQQPYFSPSGIDLMNFSIPQSGCTQFIYILPYSSTEALVEVTRFAERPIDEKEALQLRDAYLNNLQYSITYEESGAIPMTAALDVTKRFHGENERIIPIGTAAGATKPTTGYTFLKMKKHAEDIVAALTQKTPIPKPYRKYRFRLYDRILLRILRETSHYGKEIFDRLLSKAPQALVLKFLDEQTTLFDEAKLFATLPKRLFLKNLWLELKWKK